MSGIGTPYVPNPELTGTGVTLDGAHTNSVATLTTNEALTALPQSGIVLVESELILVGAFNNGGGHHYTGCTRGAYGTTAVAHADTTPVQEVMAVVKKQGGVSVYYFNKTDGALELAFIPESQESLTLSLSSQGHAVHAVGADSTAGAIAAAGTLKVVRTDTIAHAVADISDNEATIFAILTALQTYVSNLEIVTE